MREVYLAELFENHANSPDATGDGNTPSWENFMNRQAGYVRQRTGAAKAKMEYPYNPAM